MADPKKKRLKHDPKQKAGPGVLALKGRKDRNARTREVARRKSRDKASGARKGQAAWLAEERKFRMIEDRKEKDRTRKRKKAPSAKKRGPSLLDALDGK